MNTYPRVDLTYHADGNVGIGTPPDASAPLVMGEPVERLRVSLQDTMAPKVRTKVYVWKGITYLPSYKDRFMYVGPGNSRERLTLAEAALHDLGAKTHYEMLWPRFWTNGVY